MFERDEYRPQDHKWEKGEGLGSAKYFGKFLEALRLGHGYDTTAWVSFGQIDLARYTQFESGISEVPPKIEELDNWAKGWELPADEHSYLRFACGYTTDGIELDPIHPKDIPELAEAVRGLLESQSRLQTIKIVWDLAKSLLRR